jgi:hypothetical protein
MNRPCPDRRCDCPCQAPPPVVLGLFKIALVGYGPSPPWPADAPPA